MPSLWFLYWGSYKWIGYNSAKIVLVAGSWTFLYSLSPRSFFIFIGLLLFNFFIYSLSHKFLEKRKTIIYAGVIFDFVALFSFKAILLKDISKSIHAFRTLTSVDDILIPLGISFYLFQLISFLMSQGLKKHEKVSFIDFLIYISFFPQLIAGPIVLWSRFSRQTKKSLGTQFAGAGLILISLGLFKKLAIADSLFYLMKDSLSGYHSDLYLPKDQALLLIFGMTSRIYFDFSAYSDIAIGLGYLFGFSLPVNFRSPYKAKTAADFWRRWNISLMKFIKKYVAIQFKAAPRLIQLNIVFLFFAIWHAPFPAFIFFAFMHTFLVAISSKNSPLFSKLPLLIQKTIIAALILFGGVVFAGGDLGYCFHIFKSVVYGAYVKDDLRWLYVLFAVASFISCMILPNSIELLHLRNFKNRNQLFHLGPVAAAIVLFITLFFVNRQTTFFYFFF